RPLLIRKIPTPHTMIITVQGADRNPDLKHGLAAEPKPAGSSAGASVDHALSAATSAPACPLRLDREPHEFMINNLMLLMKCQLEDARSLLYWAA
ncbi:hypothetical protein ACFWIB_39085, partial [Streptomyces sp. NPDC127051]|uniref:hypothetical protein n=1 Tax=Streptomyces sp. NPDC127051 TaxID=3347119 RepID=UPI00364F052C